VFPCRERDDSYVNGKGETVKLKAKAPYTGNGKDNATTDEATIRGWWKRWPNAMIALAMGADGLFVIDFDPRMDNDTGEVWTLERLKGELEELVGGEIPSSLAVVTPSSGVHVYLQQPKDDRPRLKNRVGTKKSKHLPQHVDVRAAGGYVILPPSHCEGGESASEGHYRWLRGKSDTPVTIAPDALVDLLLKKNDDAPAPRPAPAGDRGDPSTPPPSRPRVAGEDPAREAIERYGWRALQGECKAIREAQSGARNAQLNESALKIASLTCSTPYPALDESAARAAIESAARSNPGRDDDSQLIATINSGWSAGLNSARDLAEIAASARDRASRRPTNGSAPRYPSGAASPRPAPGNIAAARSLAHGSRPRRRANDQRPCGAHQLYDNRAHIPWPHEAGCGAAGRPRGRPRFRLAFGYADRAAARWPRRVQRKWSFACRPARSSGGSARASAGTCVR